MNLNVKERYFNLILLIHLLKHSMLTTNFCLHLMIRDILLCVFKIEGSPCGHGLIEVKANTTTVILLVIISTLSPLVRNLYNWLDILSDLRKEWTQAFYKTYQNKKTTKHPTILINDPWKITCLSVANSKYKMKNPMFFCT